MSFDEGHLGFFISQKNRHFVKNNIRIFPTTLNFKLLRYFFNNIVLRLSQSYCIIDSGRHVEFCIGTKITNSDEPSNYKHSCKVGPIVSQKRLGLWCLMPLSTIFQLYRGCYHRRCSSSVLVALLLYIIIEDVNVQQKCH